ncbi:MAG: RluA family pseudouridine synthase [Spirochaetales bacterium]|nr:RluA family pseudouridine synthase [Spirochaetales bacterium]
MNDKPDSFKRPPKKYQPKGLAILYEDRDILVVNKSSGLLTIATSREKEHTAYFLLNEYVKKGNSKSHSRIFIVHRLDRDTSGVIIFAKSEQAKRFLQEKWDNVKKKYFAIIHGSLSQKEGVITSYLAENSIHKMYSVDDPARGKLAKTGYKIIRESKQYSLVEIDLFTGRKNQIRVHFADKGCPVVGDKLYGVKEKGIGRLALHAASLTIYHPFSNKEMTFEAKIPPVFTSLLNRK